WPRVRVVSQLARTLPSPSENSAAPAGGVIRPVPVIRRSTDSIGPVEARITDVRIIENPSKKAAREDARRTFPAPAWQPGFCDSRDPSVYTAVATRQPACRLSLRVGDLQDAVPDLLAQ